VSNPINLNKARKAKARVLAKAKADTNAVKFGEAKVARALNTARAEKAVTILSGHKRDDT